MIIQQRRNRQIRRTQAGFTLVEVALAMAIFAVVMGIVAQALIGVFAAMALQHERNLAAQNASAVFSRMRMLRDVEPDNFPECITEIFPNGTVIQEIWPDGIPRASAGSLTGETLRVTYTDPEENPLEARVTSNWRDPRGRPMTFTIATRITNVGN